MYKDNKIEFQYDINEAYWKKVLDTFYIKIDVVMLRIFVFLFCIDLIYILIAYAWNMIDFPIVFSFITVIILCGIAFLYKKKREVLIFKFKEKKGETGEVKWIVYDDYFQVKYIQNDMLHEYKVDDIMRIRKMGNYYVVYLHKKKFYVDTDEMGAEQAAFIEWIKNTDRLV